MGWEIVYGSEIKNRSRIKYLERFFVLMPFVLQGVTKYKTKKFGLTLLISTTV
jgi:hypothetical protein